MAFDVTAYSTNNKLLISSLVIGYHKPLADEFFELMGVEKTVLHKEYTLKELRSIRRKAVNFIKTEEDRREVKRFLTESINAAGKSSVSVWFS
jgi:hypothetical protein